MNFYISKVISTIVIITISWGGLNFFGNPWLLISILASFPLILPMIFSQRLYLSIVDLIFLLFFITLIISGIQYPNEKTLNYLLAWIIGFFFYQYRIPIFISYRFDPNSLDKVIAVGAIIIAFISIIEQILYFSTGYIVFFDLPRFDYDHANYMGLFYRSYAFSNEPSNLAYYLLLTIPFAIKAFGKFSVIFLIIGIMPSFSASGFALGFLGLSCVALFESFNKRGIKLFLYPLLSLISISTILILAYQIEIFGTIFDKLLFSSSNLSASLRLSRIFESKEVFISNPLLGLGPGYWSANFGVSPNNIYLLILTEGGLLAFLLFLIFLFGLCFSDGRRLLTISSTQIYLIVVGLGFGFFTGVSFSLIGVFFITLYNMSRAVPGTIILKSQK